MQFDFTPEELWEVAEAISEYYSGDKHRVEAETTPWTNAPYVTTLAARRRASTAPYILVEAQLELDYSDAIRELSIFMRNRNEHAELHLAVREETTVYAGTLNRLEREGVGLLLVSGAGEVTVRQAARNPALTIYPDPTLRFGKYSVDVQAMFRKFNDVNRKDALRDMCELVEGLTAQVGKIAIRRGVWTITADQFDAKDWNDRINSLASSNICQAGKKALCDHRMKVDLHAFRNARNLVDHAPRNLRERYQRERQFADKMMLGSRMVAELRLLIGRVRRL